MIKTFNESTRCQCSTKQRYICKIKNQNLYMINNKCYCRIHVNKKKLILYYVIILFIIIITFQY